MISDDVNHGFKADEPAHKCYRSADQNAPALRLGEVHVPARRRSSARHYLRRLMREMIARVHSVRFRAVDCHISNIVAQPRVKAIKPISNASAQVIHEAPTNKKLQQRTTIQQGGIGPVIDI